MNVTYIKKVNGEISDNTLPIFRSVNLRSLEHSDPSSNQLIVKIQAELDKELEIVTRNGSYITSGGTNVNSVTITGRGLVANSEITFTNNEFDWYITNRQYLYGIIGANGAQNVHIDMSQLKYCTNLLQLQTTTPSGTIDDLSLCTKLEKLEVRNNPELTGNINSIKDALSLKILRLRVSGVSGSLNDFLDYQKTKRSAGTLEVDVRTTNITYNGVVPTAVLTITFDGNGGYTVS